MRIVDFHSHILPRVDHGSDSIETSITQLKYAKSYGIDCIVSTSHFYPHRHEVLSFLSRRNEAYYRLKSDADNLDIELRLGAEVLLCSGIERLPNLNRLCLEGTNILLIELPFSDFLQEYADSVRNMRDIGFEIILAHADRYSPIVIEELINLGCKIQLNASSLASIFKKKHLFNWLDRGLVVGIGSDIHMKDKRAYKNFSTALKKIGKQRSDELMSKSKEIFDNIKKLNCE